MPAPPMRSRRARIRLSNRPQIMNRIARMSRLRGRHALEAHNATQVTHPTPWAIRHRPSLIVLARSFRRRARGARRKSSSNNALGCFATIAGGRASGAVPHEKDLASSPLERNCALCGAAAAGGRAAAGRGRRRWCLGRRRRRRRPVGGDSAPIDRRLVGRLAGARVCPSVRLSRARVAARRSDATSFRRDVVPTRRRDDATS